MGLGLRYSQRKAGWICFEEASHFPSIEKGEKYPFEINVSVFFTHRFNRGIKGYAYFPGLNLGQEHPLAEGHFDDFAINLSEKLQLRCHAGSQGGPLELTVNGYKIGTAQLEFRTPFATLLSSIRLSRRHGDTSKRKALAARMAKAARVFTSPPAEDASAKELEQRLQLLVGQIPAWAVFATNFTLTVLQIFSLLLFRKTITRLSDQEADRCSRFFAKYPILRILSTAANVPLMLTVYSTPSFLKKKDQSIPPPVIQTEPERFMALSFTPSHRWSQEPLEVDAVVVGSGAGGAAAAYELASQGHAVAILEEGHYFKRADFIGDRVGAMGRYYRDGGYAFVVSNTPVWLPTGRCVGGTTTINAGTCFRLPSKIMDRWKFKNGLTDVDLDPYFPEVEAMLDVKPVNPDLHGPIREIVEKGLQGTEYHCEPLTRGETGCDGQGHCIIGCPTGAKRSTDVSYIPAAMKCGAHLFTHYKVEEILFSDKPHESGVKQAIGVRAQLPGYGPEFSIKILAKKVILAAGSLNTPNLLSRAGLRRHLPALGRNLSIHPAIAVGARFDRNVHKKMFVPQSLAAFSPLHQNFALEGYTLAADAIPVAMPLFRDDLAELMEHSDEFANFSAMLSDASLGRLLFPKKGGCIPMYFFDAEGIDRVKTAVQTLIEMFFNAGAKTVYAPVLGFEKIKGAFDAERFKQTQFRARDFFALNAHHPLGTCVMGTDVSNSVVSSKGAVWGVENLFIVDGSVLPGPLGVNPQVTIMANAIRIARGIGKELKCRP